MKMLDINGREVKVDVRQSKYPLRKESRSKFQNKVGEWLTELYPRYEILEEFRIPSSRMSVDFFIPRVGLVVECQGKQHQEHNNFFHGDRVNNTKFGEQKIRDTEKGGWVDENGFDLLEVFEQTTKEEFICLNRSINK